MCVEKVMQNGHQSFSSKVLIEELHLCKCLFIYVTSSEKNWHFCCKSFCITNFEFESHSWNL